MPLYELFDPKARPRPIGIDLGTTHSLVAYVRDGKPICVTDCNGEALLPSVVYFGREGALVGEPARAEASHHPRETIVSVKRFMGRAADDPETRALGPYDFASQKEAPNRRVVHFKVNDRLVTPMEVSAEILRALRDLARDELQSVGPAVVTVPAHFDDAQRQATKDAGKLAGLDVLRLLNEPTAAALAYGLDKRKDGTFLVYDLGGGTFDVTVLSLESGVFQVRSTGGDTALGGDDLDRALAEELMRRAGLDRESLDPSTIRTVLDSARRVKHTLTDVESTEWHVGDAKETITRAEFEAIGRPIVERTIAPVRRALRDAGIQASELDGVILVGGATRTPIVRATVRALLGREPLTDIDPDQVVALGAAIQADLLAGDELSGSGDDVLLLDVTPLSLGVETMGGVVDKILPRNTTIPTGARSTFTTYADNQTGFELHVVQGERELAENCRSLARFSIKGIPPMPAGMARLEVTFKVDADGLLHVHAIETTSGLEQSIEVRPTYGLTDDELEQMLIDTIDHGEEDLLKRRIAEACVEGERVLLATRKALVDGADLLVEGERARIERAMLELTSAIDDRREPSLISGALTNLEHATHELAGKRMNRAIAGAISGRAIDSVERGVETAIGVDAHVEAHTRTREGH
jgi:molecular chaperone HscA